MPVIRLLIADDHPVVREGVRRIVEGHADMEVVADAVDGHDLLEKLDLVTADVLLLDVAMPGPGLELTRQLHPDLVTLDLRMSGGAVWI